MILDVVKFYVYVVREYIKKYLGIIVDDFVNIVYKNYKQSVNNLWVIIQREMLKADIKFKLMLCYLIIFWMFVSIVDGGVVVVVCSEEFMIRNNLQRQVVEIIF